MSLANPLVTVATPFHNTDLTLFGACLESVMGQTLPQDELEWVITLHNSEPFYVDAVRQMVGPYPNVRVFELTNDYHTASTPRNMCIEQARGTYIFFLDADDFLYPDAMARLSEQMVAHQADIGCFRTESIPASEGLQLVDQLKLRLLIDQTKPLLVLHRDDPDMVKFLEPHGMNAIKMYRRSLLIDHDIRFFPEVRIGEDVTFNLNCLRYVQTIVYLPQYIGHCYYMNAGSLMQTMSDTSLANLLTTLNDRYQWIKMAARCGLDTSNIVWLAMLSCMKILSNPALPPELASEWKGKLAPYVDTFPPMRGNAKFYNQQQAETFMRMVTGFFAGESKAADVNSNLTRLFEILAANADTELGQKYHFHALRTYEAFAKSVPLSGYDFYEPLIELCTRIGETNIFCGEPLVGYALSSATTGPAKRIPYTLSHLRTYVSAMRMILLEYDATFALLESLPKESEYADHTRLDSIMGATLSVVAPDLGECSFARQFKRGVLTSPTELLFPDETIDPRYPRLLFALMEPDVEQIVAPFTWTLLDTLRYFEQHAQDLIDDIERGGVSAASELPEQMRRALEAKMRPCPERAAELRREVKRGFEGIVERIWPRCKRVVSAGTGAFAHYSDLLARYLGDIERDNGFFATSEALIGRSMGAGSDEYALATGGAFFEFLEPGGIEPVDVEGLATERDYELILTNDAGLFRYRTGDVIRVRRIERGVPIFTYEYRMGESCEISGASIHERDLARVARALGEATGAEIFDFCAMAEDDHLVFFAEPAPAAASAGALMDLAAVEQARLIDEALRTCNGAYAAGRDESAISAPVLRVLQPETHLLYRDRRMFKEKVAPDQLKPVRVLTSEQERRFFTTLTEE